MVFLLLCVLTYGNTLRNKFVYDDTATVVENHFIKNYRYFPKIFTRDYFLLSKESSYRPVVTLTYFLDYGLYRLNPAGYHLTNLLLHLACVLLIYKVFTLLLGGEKAFWLALLYLTFPVNSEAVNAISFREDILVVLFGFLSFLMYLRSKNKKAFLLPSVLFYLLAMLAKENGIALLFLFLAWEFVCSGSRKEIRRLLNSHFLWYGLTLIFFLLLRFVILVDPTALKTSYLAGSPAAALIRIPLIIVKYLRRLLIPWPLRLEYSALELSISGWLLWLTAVLVVVAGVSAFLWSYRSDQTVLFGLMWFFIAFLPTSNIIPLYNPVAERYMYLPAIGFLLIVVQLLYRVRHVLAKQMILVVIAATYCFLTVSRNQDWKDDVTLWTRTISQMTYPTARAYQALATGLSREGKTEAAAKLLRTAIKIDERYYGAYNELGNALSEQGKTEEAVRYYRAGLKMAPESPVLHNNLGVALAKQGKLQEAAIHYDRALQLDRYYPQPHFNLANVLAEQGRTQEAVRHFRAALDIDRDYTEVYYNWGNLLLAEGKAEEAIGLYRLALKTDSAFVKAHINLAGALLRIGKASEAAYHYQTVLAGDPDSPEIHHNLGLALAFSGRMEEAIAHYTRVLEIRPDSGKVYYDRAVAYYSLKQYKRARQDVVRAQKLGYEVNRKFLNDLLQK